MIKDFKNVCFGKICGIEILCSLKLDSVSKCFTTYDLDVTIGKYAVSEKGAVMSHLPKDNHKEYLINEFRKMIEQIYKEHTIIEIPINLFGDEKRCSSD